MCASCVHACRYVGIVCIDLQSLVQCWRQEVRDSNCVSANSLCVYYLAGTAKRAADRDFVATAVKNDSAKNAAEQVRTFAGAQTLAPTHCSCRTHSFFEDSKTHHLICTCKHNRVVACCTNKARLINEYVQVYVCTAASRAGARNARARRFVSFICYTHV